MLTFQTHLREREQIGKFWATVVPQNNRSIQLLRRLGRQPELSDWPELLSWDRGEQVFGVR